MPHITAKLHEDHQKVEKIFQKLKDTSDGAEKTRRDLCQKLKNELMAHAEFEEAVFYPAVRDRAEADISEAVQEHKEVENMLEEIEQMEPASEAFMEKVLQLEEAVKHHVDEEENEIFPLAKDAIDKEEGEQMSQQHDEMVREHIQAAR